MNLAILAAGVVLSSWPATVTKVVDGDTVAVEVPAWASTPFHAMKVRVYGIDTPETHMPPGKCVAETKLGASAAAYAHTLLKPGDKVTLGYTGLDKYGDRVDGHVFLADGRDLGQLMINNGSAAAYNGGTKRSWCVKR